MQRLHFPCQIALEPQTAGASQLATGQHQTLLNFMLPSAGQLHGEADFTVQQDLVPVQTKVPKASAVTMVLLSLMNQKTHLT